MKRMIAIFFLIVFGVAPVADKHDVRTTIILPRGSISRDTIIIPMITEFYAFGALRRFYESRNFQMAWFRHEKLTPSADSLLRALQHVNQYGLVGKDFTIPELDSLVSLPYSLQTANRIDVLLTDAYLRLTDQVSAGRLAKETLRTRMRNHLPDSVLISGLHMMVESGKPCQVLRGFEPDNLHYRQLVNRLKAMLNEYDTGLLTSEERRFREAEMLKVAINIERWRWIQSQFTDRYLLVNIPAYTLTVHDNGKQVLESKVVVGTKVNPTPIIHSAIECFITYPYWRVPRGIATRELLPLIKKDPAYLSKNRFDVLTPAGQAVDPSTIDWPSMNAGNFPYNIRQREGPGNALGVLKFQFENPYAVYLHDTNAKKLFNTERRAYSHGCVRVEKAYELARYLIQHDSGKTTQAILDKTLRSRIQSEVILQKPLPIFIEYFTADGTATYEDVYNKDQELLTSFTGMFPPTTDLSDEQMRLCGSGRAGTPSLEYELPPGRVVNFSDNASRKLRIGHIPNSLLSR